MAASVLIGFLCPPAAIGALIFFGAHVAVSLGTTAAIIGKDHVEYLSNKEFYEQKIIDEILLEDDEWIIENTI